jgi:hypothetical protein
VYDSRPYVSNSYIIFNFSNFMPRLIFSPQPFWHIHLNIYVGLHSHECIISLLLQTSIHLLRISDYHYFLSDRALNAKILNKITTCVANQLKLTMDQKDCACLPGNLAGLSVREDSRRHLFMKCFSPEGNLETHIPSCNIKAYKFF